jgi:hypothetical protein
VSEASRVAAARAAWTVFIGVSSMPRESRRDQAFAVMRLSKMNALYAFSCEGESFPIRTLKEETGFSIEPHRAQ